jgi:hypothetical protein
MRRALLALAPPLAAVAAALAGPAPEPPEKVTHLDLQPKGTRRLKEQFHGAHFANNNLAALPPGKRPFAGVPFRVGRKFVQLRGGELKDAPVKVEGIKVGRAFGRLHILHACGWRSPDNTLIGEYVVRYADGTRETIEVVYGKDVRDWWHYPGTPAVTRGKVAWEGSNPAAKSQGASLKLYLTTWKNPHPKKKVASIDYVSRATTSAPFCIAMTVED